MSELSIIQKESRKGIGFKVSDGFLAVSGFCAGIASNELLAQVLFFCVLGYFFQKSLWECTEFALMFFVGSFFCGLLQLYQNFLIFLFFALLILFARVVHASMFHVMPWILSAVSFLMVLVRTSGFMLSFQAALMSFVLMKLCSSEKILIQRSFKISSLTFSFLILILSLSLRSVLSSQQFLFLCALLMVVSAVHFETQTVLVIFGILNVLMKFDQSAFVWLFSGLLVHFLRGMGMKLMAFYPVICAVLTESVWNAPAGLLMISLALCLPERNSLSFLETEHEDHLLKMRIRHKEQLLQHQLNQFSQVFDLIAEYYASFYEAESSFLRGMAESLSLLSLQMKQSAFTSDDEAWKITELLKGMHYDVIRIHVTQSDSGMRKVEMLINGCVRKDVDDVILPMVRMSIDPHLKVISVRKAQKFSDTVRIEMAGEVPLVLRAKAYRTLDENRISGDTCSIFQNGNLTICTISDGMGIGESAQKASSFMTYLTQRLVSCGIPIEMAVKSINSLCSLHPKEQFATLDFMCFDAMNHQVIFSKNGAAPSYLIRERKVMKIEGHALPLGIVEKISADCCMMEVKKKDLILMCSDGAEEDLIQQWLLCTDANELRKTIEKSIKECQKRDDLSVIVAEVL